MVVPSGSQLGPYEVLGLLGSGGMGEVYRARDPRLDREVAIKVLPEEIANRDRLRRFEQEARAAGALNHPNVLAVYDIGTHDGAPYVVSELLEGHTLGDRLKSGALPVRRAVDYAVQIAHGLAAAHDKGIVHRDLKPDNVFLTEDGRVKILDFGLAKLTRRAGLLEPDGERTATKATESGTVLGTVGYMSPEQVRGEEVDPRSDIFSFGAVLYEMLSGRRAFRRDNAAETMAAILKEDPPELSGTGRAIPPALARIVHRCLEKRPGDRFHSAHDLALALEAVSSGVTASVESPGARRSRLAWSAALVALVALVGGAGLWVGRSREPEAPAGPLRVRPLTSTTAVESDPALSPDGTLLAFVREGRAGQAELCVKQVNGGGQPLVIASGKGWLFTPTWSPDGQRLAFIRHVEAKEGAPNDGVFVISALGGPESLLATMRTPAPHGLTWSPDGRSLAVPHAETPGSPGSIHLLSIESGERRQLTHPPDGHLGDVRPRFSPDGRTLAFIRQEAAFETDIYLVPVEGGEERRLTVGNTETNGLDWTPDGKAIVFSAWQRGGGGEFCLWRMPAWGGDPTLISVGENGGWPSLSREGGRLAYVRTKVSWDIRRVAGPEAPPEERAPTPLIASTAADLHPRYSPDGLEIAFTSRRSGTYEVWVCENDGSQPRQLTFLDSSLVASPSWSPDGETIAFLSTKEGSWDVWTVSAAGRPARRLTTDPAREFASSWSRDGRWIYFFSNVTGRFEVWKVPAAGGEPVQVTRQGGTAAIESPDGRFLYFNKGDMYGPVGIWRMPRDGGEEVQVLEWGRPMTWAVLPRGIFYMSFDSTGPSVELYDPASGQVTWTAELDRVNGPGFTVSPDGRWVLYVGGDAPEADIMLVEGFR